MIGDLSGVFVAVLAVTGAILLVDALIARQRRRAGITAPPPPERAIVTYSRSLFPVILCVLLFRSFLFEPFRIPSASMMPGLVDGDFILVNKFTYGLRLPVINTRVVSVGQPRRG